METGNQMALYRGDCQTNHDYVDESWKERRTGLCNKESGKTAGGGGSCTSYGKGDCGRGQRRSIRVKEEEISKSPTELWNGNVRARETDRKVAKEMLSD